MKRWFLILLILIILILSLGGLVLIISQRTTFFGRAYTPKTGGIISLQNSYLFASPLQALADGQEKIRLTVFLLDAEGRGVRGENVFLGQHDALQIVPVQPTTDELGRAIFDISASQPGEYIMEARVGSQILPQQVKIRYLQP